MKNLSIRFKTTLWYSVTLIVLVFITSYIVIEVSDQVLQKTIRDSLISTVESNVDEVEYFASITEENLSEIDYYLPFNEGFLEIDDDFLDEVNGVYTTLYSDTGTFIYGENPIAEETVDLKFVDASIQTLTIDGVVYYVFDRKLTAEGLDGLWLRGVVSELQGSVQINSITNTTLIVLPLLVVIAIIGGYLLIGRMLRPLEKMAVSAQEISEGKDLEKRIDIGEGSDEVHRLANSFNEMLDRLDNSFEIERKFTSDASHELRTPMAVISAQCEMALEQEQTVEEYQQALQVIQRQSNKMNSLISNMLDFTRLESSVERYPKQEIDLSQLVDSVCLDSAIIQDKDIELQWESAADIKINGNIELLTRLLNNLISNAYRYGKENGHIFVSLAKTDEQIVLKVEDDGIGIAEEEQEKIFHRFYQVDASRSSDSNGLGLAMAGEIVKFHNGEIRVESELGKGSSFIVTF